MIAVLTVQAPSGVIHLTTPAGTAVIQPAPATTKVIQLGIQGPSGPAGNAASGVQLIAGEIMGGGKVVYAGADGKSYLADSGDIAQIGLIEGLTLGAATADAPVNVVASGPLTTTGLTPGAAYFLGTAGGIVKEGDAGFPTVGFLQPLGTAASATLLIVLLGPPIEF